MIISLKLHRTITAAASFLPVSRLLRSQINNFSYDTLFVLVFLLPIIVDAKGTEIIICLVTVDASTQPNITGRAATSCAAVAPVLLSELLTLFC